MRTCLILACAAAATVSCAVPAPAAAQEGFLFRSPQGQLTARAGGVLFSAGSDCFGWATDTLTLSRRDFRGPSVALEAAYLAGPHFDIVVGLGWAETERRAEYRYWEGDDDEPIEQFTRLRTVPLTGTVRYRPLPRGRRLSELAWLPARTSPYIGGGAGVTWYRLVQEGEFIDDDFVIWDDSLESRGAGLAGHAVAGLDHWVTSRIGVNLEARYNIGSAPMDQQRFGGFDDLDLGGLQLTFGLSYRW
jgi:hypothetical protein